MLHRLGIIARPSLLAIVLLSAVGARAGERCEPPDEQGNVLCVVGIPSERLEPVTSQQRMSQWCWAASISMLFGFHGHAVSQERIVQSVWGQLVDLPAMSGSMMSESLARPWVDDRGRRFQARVRVFDVDAGQYGVDTDAIIDELRAERPLLVGTVGHAMVMTALRYVTSPSGMAEVVGATVRDPWPGIGRRELEWHEMEPRYVATVDIARPPDARTSPRPGSQETATGGCETACDARARACERSAPGVDACVAEQVEACVEMCVFNEDLPARICRQELCDPRRTQLAWRRECREGRELAVAECRAEQSACRELCR